MFFKLKKKKNNKMWWLLLLVCIGIIGASLTVWKLIYPDTDNKETFITYSKLEQNGRLGNQLFQIAAIFGFKYAAKDKKVILKPWKYQNIFSITDSISFEDKIDVSKFIVLNEAEDFKFDDNNIQSYNKKSIDIDGYRQHFGYFHCIAHEIRRLFDIQSTFLQNVQKSLLENPLINHDEPLIGLHVRRGDYVNNKTHEVCNLAYYKAGIDYFRLKNPLSTIIIMTDDKEWCQQNLMNEYNNILLSTFETEIDDFICLHLCEYKVISNSTFALWACWLDARWTSEVILPTPWINGEKFKNNYECLYQVHPLNWHVYDVHQNQFMSSHYYMKQDYKNEEKLISIGAYYQCYKQPKAFINCLKSYRRVYPKNTLVIVNDAGDDLSKAAKYFNVDFWSVNPERSGNGTTNCLTDRDLCNLYIFNFLHAAQKIKQSYFVYLEDDIAIVRTLKLPPTYMDYDMIGNTNNSAKFNDATMNLLKDKTTNRYYGGCGGSLFKTSFWANLNEDLVMKQIDKFKEVNQEFHSDIVLSYICLMNNGTIACGQDLYPTEFAEKPVSFGSDYCPSILHMYKDLYNQPLTEHETFILNYSDS